MTWRDFLRGFGSAIDLFGVSAPRVDTPRDDREAFERDAAALRGDWSAVLGDMARARKSANDGEIARTR